MQYVCPHCPKTFKKNAYLNAHIARVHTNLNKENTGAIETPSETKQQFQVKKPAQKKTPSQEQETSDYHCLECGNPVAEGQNPCPSCGARLDWEASSG